MAKRKVKKFNGDDLGGGKRGLHTTVGSSSHCQIDGDNFEAGDPVVAKCVNKYPNLTWNGMLDNKTGKCTLTCTSSEHDAKKKPKIIDTDQVTVTVGTGADTSDPYTEPNVNLAP
jgi:hypothetical protein